MKIIWKITWSVIALALVVGMVFFWIYALESKDLIVIMSFVSGMPLGFAWVLIWSN